MIMTVDEIISAVCLCPATDGYGTVAQPFIILVKEIQRLRSVGAERDQLVADLRADANRKSARILEQVGDLDRLKLANAMLRVNLGCELVPNAFNIPLMEDTDASTP